MDLVVFDLDVLIKFRVKFKEFLIFNVGLRNSWCYI